MAIEKILNTRVQLKYDSYANWTDETKQFKLRPGEMAVVNIDTANGGDLNNGTKNIVTQPTILFKVGTGDSADNNTWKTFNELPWASALAADVYSWAKQSSLPVVRDANDGTEGNVISSIKFENNQVVYTTASVATSEGMAALQKTIDDNRDAWALDTDTQYSFSTDGDKLVVKKALYTNGVKGEEVEVGSYEFLTSEEVNALIGKANITINAGDGLIEGGSFNVNAADNSIISIKHAIPTGAADGTKDGITTDQFGHVTGVDLSDYAKSEDIGITAESCELSIGMLDQIEAKGAKLTVNNKSIAIVADYAENTESTNGNVSIVCVSDSDYEGVDSHIQIFVDGYTQAEVDDKFTNTINELELGSMSKKDAGNYYTKDEANEEFATPEEVINAVDDALAKVSSTDTINGITTLVNYVNENASDLTAVIKEVYGAESITETSRIDTAVDNAAAAVNTANSASGVAGEAKQLAEQAHAAATTAQGSASASAAAAEAAASTASTKAGEATAAAGTATTKAGEADASAQAAATSESNANTSAQAAAASAGEAQNSASTANGAKQEAVAAKEAAIGAQEAAEVAQGAAESAKGAAETAQSKAEAAQKKAEEAQAAAEASNTSATAIANEAKDKADAASQVVAGLHAIATSGNVNDLVQTSGDVLIFNCGSATVNV